MYTYICVCVCVCVYIDKRQGGSYEGGSERALNGAVHWPLAAAALAAWRRCAQWIGRLPVGRRFRVSRRLPSRSTAWLWPATHAWSLVCLLCVPASSRVCSRLLSCVSACVSNAHLVCPPFLRTSRLACIARTDWHAHGLGMAVVHTRMQAYSTKNTSYTGNGIKGSS